MKVEYFKKNRTLKEWLNIVPQKWFENVSLLFLLVWVCTPLLIMFLNVVNFRITDIVNYYLVLYIGFFGLIISLTAFLKKKFENNNLKDYNFKKKLIKYSDKLFLLIMLLLALISCLLAKDKISAFLGNTYRHEGYITYIAYIGFFTLVLTLKNEKKRKILMHIFCFVATIMSVLTILQFYRIPIRVFINFRGMLSAVFYNSNHYAYYLTIAVMVMSGIFITNNNLVVKVLYLIEFIISIFVLIVNDTFGAYSAVFIGIIFSMLFLSKIKTKNFFYTIIIFIIFIVVSIFIDINYNIVKNNIISIFTSAHQITTDINNSDYIGAGRMGLWKDSFFFIKQKPIFGFGLENLHCAYNGYKIMNNNRPHNEYLQHAVFMGVPALLCYISSLFIIVKNNYKYRKKISDSTQIALCSMIAYCASAFFGNTMFYTTPYFIIMLSMCSSYILKEKG